jgi:hypothetical protein
MISVREHEVQLVATYRDRLARVERGEFSYSAEEQAVELQRLKKAIAVLEQDSKNRPSCTQLRLGKQRRAGLGEGHVSAAFVHPRTLCTSPGPP